MQKIMMLLFALITTTMANAQSVYIATSNGAVAYHKSKDCGYLRNAKEVKSISQSGAEDMGRHACSACYDGRSAASTKTAPKATRPSVSRKTAPAESPTVEKKAVSPRKSGKTVAAEKEPKVKVDAKEKAETVKKTASKKSTDAKEKAETVKKTASKKSADTKEKAETKTKKATTKKASTAKKTVKEAA